MSKDSKAKHGLGYIFIEIALAVIFIVAGVGLLADTGWLAGTEIRKAVASIFNDNTLRSITCIAIGIVLILCGVFIFLQLFGVSLGTFDKVISLIALIVWIAVAVIVHVVAKGAFQPGKLYWYGNVAKDLLIVGGLLLIK